MELEGLIRCLQFLEINDLGLKTIVTDRHVQINKWLRENMEDVDHRFDIWHLAKGMLHNSHSLQKLKCPQRYVIQLSVLSCVKLFVTNLNMKLILILKITLTLI